MPLQVTHGPVLSLHADGRQLLLFARLVESSGPPEHRADPVTFLVQVRQSGSTTSHGPFPTRPDKRQTALAAVPVTPGTAADYWLADEDGRRLTRTFRCLPPRPDQGEVVIYQVADTHGLNETWPATLLQHHLEHHPDVAAAVLCMGDLWNVYEDETASESALQDHYLGFWAVPAVKRLFSQIPILQMWDDWDYLGDNSCRTHTGARGLREIDRKLALQVRKDFMPGPRRLAPAGAMPDAGFSVNLGGCLLLVPDSRSMKEAAARSTGGVCYDMLDGSQPAPCWDEVQREWMMRALDAGRTSYKVFLVSSHSFADNLQPPVLACEGTSTGVRDSLGLFHKWERNELLKQALALGLLEPERRFIVLSGDDHTPLVRRRAHWHAPYRLKEEAPVPEPALDGAVVWEFKAGNGGRTTTIFDSDDEPPVWWGGCAGEYQSNPPAWGRANSRKADVAFCWHIVTNGDDRHCTVRALLLEDEPPAPCPGQLPRTAPRVLLERDFS
jgi:hypothetical protein